jgi:hypothetical protein
VCVFVLCVPLCVFVSLLLVFFTASGGAFGHSVLLKPPTTPLPPPKQYADASLIPPNKHPTTTTTTTPPTKIKQYADVVRLENYHFFVQTMSPRQQRLLGSAALLPYIDQAQVIA